MSYIGLLSLGIFVGTLLCVAVRKTTEWTDAIKSIVAMIGVALSGVVFTFIEKILGASIGPAVFMYPVGLAWSMLWLFGDICLENLKSEHSHQKLLGWLHLCGMVFATLLVLLLLFSEGFRDRLPE